MIQLRDICLSFGTQKVFNDISTTFNEDQRIGLVGNNGSGKSTLLKVIAGSLPLDDGEVACVNSKTLAYMPQEVVLTSDKSILDETFSVFDEIATFQQRLDALQSLIDQGTASEEDFSEYADIAEKLALHNPDSLLTDTKKMLTGLGFNPANFSAPVTSLSVGWKMRIVLAKLLLQKADFYLFDEPTNHLDIFAKEWFLGFLKSSSFGFLLVCHERYFLDELCTHIFELERGKGTLYRGNYSSYLTQKEHNRELQERAYVQQQKEVTKKQEFIDRFKASASRAKSAQSAMKALERMELIEAPQDFNKKMRVRFSHVPNAGKSIIKVNDISYHFDQKPIFQHVSFEIEKGKKVALVAANGVGKTTLCNILMNKYAVQEGSFSLGYNVFPAFFEQDQHRALNGKNTILEELNGSCPKKTEAEIRGILGAFLFTGDDVKKKISVLSGGEKNRVAMAKVLLQDANFLILDEPTNHLDIISKEILLTALQEYPGTILFVSHDRDFLNALATDVIELTPSGAHMYHGNYDSFVYQKNFANGGNANVVVAQETHKIKPKESAPVSGKELYELRKKAKRLEEKMETLTSSIAKLQLELPNYSFGTQESSNITNKIKEFEHQHNECFQQWELLQQKLESMQSSS